MQERFRPGPQVHARRFDDETVILDLIRGEYFALDEVGATVWDRISDGMSLSEIADQVVATYDVDVETARRDVQRIVSELVDAKLLEPQP